MTWGIGDTIATVKRVEHLPPNQRDTLLYALIGRMVVLDPDALVTEIEQAEADAIGAVPR